MMALKLAFTGLAFSCLALLACADDTSRDPLARACISVSDVLEDEVMAIARDVAEDYAEPEDGGSSLLAAQMVAIWMWMDKKDARTFYQALDRLCSDAELETLGFTRESLESLITDK